MIAGDPAPSQLELIEKFGVTMEKKLNEKCPCAYADCERHGDCEACKGYHHALGQKTSCEKQKR